MSKRREEHSVESLIDALRADVVELQGAARQRVGARLAIGLLPQLVAAAVVPSFPSRGFFQSKALAVALALPLGVAIGASGHAWLESSDISAEPAARPGATVPRSPSVAEGRSTPETPPPSAQSPAPAVPIVVPAPSQRAAARASSVHRSAVSGDRELAQLEKARMLLSEGHVEATLALLQKNVASYRHSRFEQERQALHIKALVAADRMVEARARAATFVMRFPSSTLRGSVESSVASIP